MASSTSRKSCKSASMCLVLLIFLSVFRSSYQASQPEDLTYIAGVVEFREDVEMSQNLAGYREIINSPNAIRTDIIVFPELTLNTAESQTYVPNPADSIVPCNRPEYDKSLGDMSCYAKSAKKYIVINVIEKENCTAESQKLINDPRPCASNGLNEFNTNVVFDREGKVISKYRKFHLYGEKRNTTLKPEPATFETDFGVTFGHFICFDILFYAPTQQMVEMGVTDFIFPTKWFSELPFLTATQIQQAWAYGNNVNLLAAGASNPKIGSTGTGIYAGRKGALVSVMNSIAERKLYVVEVPKMSLQLKGNNSQPKQQSDSKSITPPSRTKRSVTNMNDIRVIQENVIENYSTVPFNPHDKNTTSQKVCQNGFCCTFEIKAQTLTDKASENSYKYRLAVFNGWRSYQNIEGSYIRSCAIIACTDNESLTSCGKLFRDEVDVTVDFYFESIKIEGEFPATGPNPEKLLIMPNSVDRTLTPLPVDAFIFTITEGSNKRHVRKHLIKSQKDLLTFGIYANYYDHSGADSTYTLTLPVLVATLIAAFSRSF